MGIVIAFILSACLNILMILGLAYLFKWRKSVGDNTLSIVPNELIDLFKSNKNKMEVELGKNSQSLVNIEDFLNILVQNNTEKDKEIKRLKEGYDIKIYKGFLNRFFRIYQEIEKDLEHYQNNNEDQKVIEALNGLKIDLKEAFLDCGLEEFSPKEGELYRDSVGVEENPKEIETTVEVDDMKIAEIRSKGFKTVNNDREEILKPAVVSIYKYNKGA